MTVADDLNTIKNNILSNLKEITDVKKPNYEIDGQKISWQDYFDSLMSNLDKVNMQIDRESGPFEERTKVFT
jgi:hypothetical protein